VYTPIDACIVILAEDYNVHGRQSAKVSQLEIDANEFVTNLIVGMTRLPDTPASVYSDICTQAANQQTLTLYAYLYERNGSECVRPQATVSNLVYDKFELAVTTDVWSTGFCADSDVRRP
jgi:hypothetical protein